MVGIHPDLVKSFQSRPLTEVGQVRPLLLAVLVLVVGVDEFCPVAPESRATSTTRRYVEGTLVLKAEGVTPDRTIRVTDLITTRDDTIDVVRIVERRSRAVPPWSKLRTTGET